MSRAVPPLLGRYLDLIPIRASGRFHVLAARRADDARPCVLVLPGPEADLELAARRLAEVARVHALLDHPQIPRVTWAHLPGRPGRQEPGALPFLELACEAVVDGVELLRLLAEAGRRIPYGAADAFGVSLRRALQAAHAVTDDRRGGPVCLGRLSAASILFDRTGRWSLIGFGHNLPVERETGDLEPGVTALQAPELSSGAPPTPMGDYVALLLFLRTLLPHVELAGEIGRILTGHFRPADEPLIDAMRWVEQRVVGELPALRASLEEALAVADRIRQLNGHTVDEAGFGELARTLLQEAEGSPLSGIDPAGPGSLVLGPDGAWVAGPDGHRHRLGRSLRLLLLAFVERHARRPGQPLTVQELLEAAWPGEQPLPEAGANRVYVSLNRLRGLGLRELIDRFGDGYRLEPSTVVRWAEG